MQCLSVFEQNNANVVFEFLNPTPTDDAATRCSSSISQVSGDFLAPLAFDLRPLPQNLLEVGRCLQSQDDTSRINDTSSITAMP
jgi:hypothetical protein